MWGRVDVRWVASAAVALILLPGQVSAQSVLAQSGPRPGMNRIPPQAAPASRRPQIDLLDLRDRHDTAPVTPLAAAPSTVSCVAGCGDGASRAVVALPLKPATILGVVGPMQDAKLIQASVSAPAAAPALADSGVITCLAGCDSNDRRVMQATGGPLAAMPRQPSLPPRFITAAAAPMVTAPVVKSQPVKPFVAPVAKAPAKPPAKVAVAAPAKLKRTISAHVKRVDKTAKSAARKSAGTQMVQIAKPVPHIAAVGVPTPIQPAQPSQKPQPAVSPRKPVAVNTSSDWFNKISRDQAAKKKADEAIQ